MGFGVERHRLSELGRHTTAVQSSPAGYNSAASGPGHMRAGVEGVARFATYAALGTAIGALVAAVDWLVIEQLIHRLDHGPLWLMMATPGLGLVLATFALRLGGPDDASTSDEYVKTFHSGDELKPRRLPGKMLAAMATIGSGGALGLEGPSILAGSTFGQWLGRRRLSYLGKRGDRILLVAGAAAGVASIFKAPATGVLFALETPYKRDIARNPLIPALVASSAAYLVFALTIGSGRLLPIGAAELDLTDEVGGAVVLGIFGGLAARWLSVLFKWAKHLPDIWSPVTRIPLAAVVLAITVLLSVGLVDEPVTFGPGAESAIGVVLDASIPIGAIALLFLLRAVATSATLGAGGVGGVFIPLVVQGLLLGRIVQELFGAPSNGLYPVVGLAAVLGAAYRTPLAAVMFVAETTGRAEFVIPALLATAVAQAVVGEQSVSSGQVGERQGVLERRLEMRAGAVVHDEIGYLDADRPLLEVVDELERFGDIPAIAVCTGSSYHGLLNLHDIAASIMEYGPEATAGQAYRTMPAVSAEASARDAAFLMNDHDSSAVAVVDGRNRPVGVVSAMSLTGIRDINAD